MNTINQKKLTDAFLGDLAEGNLAPGTLKAYRSVLVDFCHYVEEHSPPVEQPTELADLMSCYVEQLCSRGLRAHSINRAIFVLNLFSRSLGIACGLSKVRPDEPAEMVILTENQWHALVKASQNCSHVRDRCLMLLLLQTGLKPQECCNLNLEDLHLECDSSWIRVSGRYGNRSLPVLPDLTDCLRLWLQERHRLHAQPSCQALFLTQQGKRLSAYAFDQVVRKIGIRAGIVLSALTIRNTLLQRVSAAGTPIQIVTMLAGHSSWRYVQRYYGNQHVKPSVVLKFTQEALQQITESTNCHFGQSESLSLPR